MTLQEAIAKGFLNLNDQEVQQVLDSIFDNDNAEERMDQGWELLLTFIPEDKIGHVLNLADLVLDAHEELEYDEEPGEGDDHDHAGHDHDHGPDHKH